MGLRRFTIVAAVTALIGSSLVGTAAAAGPALPAAVPTVSRLAGADRVGTAVEISQHAYPAAFTTGGSVYLARMDVFADAVAAGTLTDGPVLLVPSCAAVPQLVRDEVARLAPARVVALGGTGAVCDHVLAAVAGSRSTARLAGVDRYLTSLEIARERARQAPVTEVYVASGLDSPDAVVGGQLTRGPILLTGTVDRSAEYNTFVDAVKPTRVVALGGPAVVTEMQLSALMGSNTRLSGQTRYETAAAIAMREFPEDADAIYLARGDVFADAVAAGSLRDGPVVMVESCSLPVPARERIAAARPLRVIALGGPGAVCDAVLSQAQAALTANGGRNSLVSVDQTGWAYAHGVTSAAISADNASAVWAGYRGSAGEPWGIYLTDLKTGHERRVSVPPPGRTFEVVRPEFSVSGNGRRVAFAAKESRFGPGIIYVHDVELGVTKQLSRVSAGDIVGSWDPSISSDGSKVVYVTKEKQTEVDPGFRSQVYVAAVDSGQITMITLAQDGTAGNGASDYAEISADGRTVALYTRATNLFHGGPTANVSVAVADLATASMERFYPRSSSGDPEAYEALPPQMSADGSTIAFLVTSPSSGGSRPSSEIIVTDRLAGTSQRASLTPDGKPTSRRVTKFDLSADGKTVVFATNLDPNAVPDAESGILQHDLVTRRTKQLAARFTGAETVDLGTQSDYWMLGMSPDATRVLMLSEGPRLVPHVDPRAEVPVLWTELTAR